MDILVIGGGGREHAIIKKLRENPSVGTIFALPGNGGIAFDAVCLGGSPTDIPGIVAAYRYRFALYNLYENPGIGVMEALDMSKRQTWGYKSQIFALDWSYFGWQMLASLPLLAMLFLLYRLVFQIVTGPIPNLTAEELVAQALVLPVWAWSLISSVFSLAVGLFYVPNRECVELGYFEIAKRTSGVGWNAAPPRPEDNPNSGWTGGWGQM